MDNSYRPANSEEGEWFMAKFCDHCIHDTSNKCRIKELTLILDEDDPDYPQEWVYSDEDKPTCTAFEQIDILPVLKDRDS